MKKYLKFSNGVKMLGAAALGIVLSAAVFTPVKAADISGSITESALSENEENILTDDVVLTIENDKTIVGIVLNGHDLTINGSKTLTINGRIRPGGNNNGNLTINNGVKIVASFDGDGHTVFVNDLNVDGGSIKATYSGSGISSAIHMYNSMNMSSGKVEGISKNTGISSDTVYITGGKVTAQGGNRAGLFGSSGIEISGDDTVVKAVSADSYGIVTNTGGVTISDGKITASGGGTYPGIYGKPEISIEGSETVVDTNGLKADNNITIADGATVNSTRVITAQKTINISGENTVVKAKTSAGSSAIQSTDDHTIIIDDPLKIIKPSGGRNDDGEIKERNGSPANDVEIRKQKRGGGSADKTDDIDDTEPSKPVVVNNDAIIILSMTGLPAETFLAKQEQGPAGKYALALALPKGYQEAFTFNMITNGLKGDYSLKKGKVTIVIPAKYRKAGRVFALLGIDKSGKLKVFNDIDVNNDTITVNIDIEGYAFDLIYSD